VAVCAVCGTENPEGARFCFRCGTAFEPAEAREQRKLVSVVFCDVVGSTALGESSDAEAVRALLGRYFERMRGVVERHGGTVQKFAGDAVMAVFGVPVVHEDDALRACRAAVEMRAALPELGVEARIGVNTGEVIAVTEEWLVTGDAVNVAARLEQAAAPGEVLIGEETFRLVQGAVTTEAVEPLTVKGKSRQVVVYRLHAVGGREPMRRWLETPLVGRERELEILEGALERAVEGRSPQLATVVGSPGIGKSRLARELVQRSRARALVGHCLSYGEGITYRPLAEIVAQVGDVRAALGDDLEADLAVARIAAGLGSVGAASSPEEIAWGFRRLLEALAREQPLVVVVDDIHWAEPALLDLIEYVTTFASDAHLLVLCLARHELLELRPGWSAPRKNATLVTLEPLGSEQAELLVDRYSGVPAAARARIVAVAEGNPLFVEQLLAMQAEAGGDEIEIPTTIRALLSARIDRLEPVERLVAERASIEGTSFHRGSVASLLPEPSRADLGASLLALVRKELIRPERTTLAGEDAFRFDHVLIRDAAYDSIPKRLRVELHERFAGWLDARGEDERSDELLGYHLEQAHRYRAELGTDDPSLGERAAAHLVVAGQRARDRGDILAAANLLQRALAAGLGDPRERARVQGELAYPLHEMGRVAEANSLLKESIGTATGLGERGLATRLQVQVWTHDLWSFPNRHPDEHERRARHAIETFEELGDQSGLADAERLLGRSLTSQGRQGDALAAQERALVHAEAAGDQAALRRVVGSIGMALINGSTPVGTAIRRGEELREAHGDDSVLAAVVTRHLSYLYAMAGHAQGALEAARASSLVLDELQLPAYLTIAALARQLAGDGAGAEHDLKTDWLRLRDRVDTGSGSRGPVIDLANFYCDEGRWNEAADLLAYKPELVGSFSPSSSSGAPTSLITGLSGQVILARLAAHRGEHTEALALIEPVVTTTEGTSPEALNNRARVQLALAEAQRAAGNNAEAEVAVAKALALYDQKGNVAAAGRVRASTP
jgi:class 3 adenylate cyclase/tetratricopeptide (TPR) repeat protein